MLLLLSGYSFFFSFDLFPSNAHSRGNFPLTICSKLMSRAIILYQAFDRERNICFYSVPRRLSSRRRSPSPYLVYVLFMKCRGRNFKHWVIIITLFWIWALARYSATYLIIPSCRRYLIWQWPYSPVGMRVLYTSSPSQ